MAIGTIKAATLTGLEASFVAVLAASSRRSSDAAARATLGVDQDTLLHVSWSVRAKFGIELTDDLRTACRLYINAQETN